MSAEMLHRIQFGLTASFHFIFPPMSLGLGLVLIIFGVQSVRTGDPKWRQLSAFWVRIYGLIFAMGIATGLVQEFEFGMNWSGYSRFVGNIFGSLLAAEGVFAFMLEGGFLGLMLFGGTRLGNRLWLFATTMVVGGATLSATWIVMANAWMQTPAGYEIKDVGQGPQAFMTSFSDVVFTKAFVPNFLHTLAASWMVGTSLVLSVAAYYLLRRRHIDLAKTMIHVALPIFTVTAVLQVAVFGANVATRVAEDQPAKLAAMEGLYETTSCAPMYLLGFTNPDDRTTTGLSIPCMLSILTTGDPDGVVTGLEEAAPRDQWPAANIVFQTYHLMINLGMLFIAIGLVASGLWLWRRKLWDQRWMLWILVSSIVLTQLATLTGWWTAEIGRQPWIVWQLLTVSGAQSPNVSSGQVMTSIIMFVVLYAVVFVVFIRLLDRHIKVGPPPPGDEEETASLPDSFGEIFSRRSRTRTGAD